MPADQIFVLVLVIGIVLSLGWMSVRSHRRADLERQSEQQAVATAAAELPSVEASEPARPERRRRRKR